MSKFFASLLMVVFLISCDKDDQTGNQEPNNPLTESLVELGIKYGSEDRQFLDLYKAESDCPTPIYFDAHGNNGNTSIPDSLVDDLNAQGITIIALTKSIQTHPDFQTKVAENTDEQNKNLAFQKILDDVMAKQRKQELDLYRLYAKDEAFKTAFFDTMKRMSDNTQI